MKRNWTIDNSHPNDYEGIQIWEEDVIIAHVIPDQHLNHVENAKLIAAAPEMLEALKSINRLNLHLYGEGTVGNIVYKIVQSAIQKATNNG